MKKFILLLCTLNVLLLNVCIRLEAQTPPIKHYNANLFQTAPYLWAGVQDNRGVLYFGANDGVVMFDGINFRLIPTPYPVRGLAKDARGNVYVGCKGDMGLLTVNAQGKYVFKSFRDILPSQNKDLLDVSKVLATKKGIYFIGNHQILLATKIEAKVNFSIIKLPESKGDFSGAFTMFDELYINTTNSGLMKVTDKFQEVSGGEFLKDKVICSAFTQNNQTTVIVTAHHGLYAINGGNFSPYPTALDGLVKQETIQDAVMLSNGTLCLGTLTSGLYCLTKNNKTYIFNKSTGFEFSDSYMVFEDKEGGLWYGHEQGLSYFGFNANVQYYNTKNSLAGQSNAVILYKDQPYVATTAGLYTLSDNGINSLNAPKGEYWAFAIHGNRLFAAGDNGIFEIQGTSITPVVREQTFYALAHSQKGNVLFAASDLGVYRIDLSSNTATLITESAINPNTLWEDPNGDLWIGTNFHGVLKVRNAAQSDKPSVEKIKLSELGEGIIRVAVANQSPALLTDKGVFLKEGEKFTLHPALSAYIRTKQDNLFQTPDKKIIITTNLGLSIGTINGNAFDTDSLNYTGFVNEKPAAFYATDKQLVVAVKNKVIVSDRVVPQKSDQKLPRFVTTVTSIIAGQDSVVYDGLTLDVNNNLIPQGQDQVLKLSADLNQLTVRIGAPSYYNTDGNVYQYWLKGSGMETWSDWSNNPVLSFNGLAPGAYTLLVRSRNALGQTGEPAVLSFKISPPWYRSPLAYIAYIIFALGGIYLLFRLNLKRLEAQNKKLEGIVQARTAEVVAQKNELAQKNQDLEVAYRDLAAAQNQLVQSEKMAALGQLISSVAHEINTPLGAINGASGVIAKQLYPTVSSLSEVLTTLVPSQKEGFLSLINKSFEGEVKLTTREERNLIREKAEVLTAANIPGAQNLATRLVKAGIIDNYDKYYPLFVDEAMGDKVIDTAANLGRIKTSIDNIQLAVAKTQKIVFALKSFAYRSPDEKPVVADIPENIQTVLTIYQNQLKHNVNLVTEIEPNLPPILCFPDELNQVWTNIIHNALQAMDNKGDLTIKVWKVAELIHVSITDSGKGIPPEIINKIFDPFFTTKKQGEGTGLGLDICRKIIEKHQGKISVESQPGKTTFTVTLPIKLSEN